MKNLILSTILAMTSLMSNSQEQLIPAHIDVQVIQREFMALYYRRADSLRHAITEDKSLLCLSQCQLSYLKNLEDISHKQEPGSVHYSLQDRFAFYYPELAGRSNTNVKIGEIISKSGTGKNLYKHNNEELAIRLFKNFMLSDGHREIMDNKEMVKVNFQVAITIFGDVLIVGVLSNQVLK